MYLKRLMMLAVVVVSTVAGAETYTWTGAQNGFWTNAANWTVSWIDENVSAFDGTWLARKILLARTKKSGKPPTFRERGRGLTVLVDGAAKGFLQ